MFFVFNERYTKNYVDVCIVSPTGPGLAIRIICGDEPYQGSDFAETNIILGQIVDFVTAIKKVCIKSVFLVTVDVGVRNISLRENIAGGYVCFLFCPIILRVRQYFPSPSACSIITY